MSVRTNGDAGVTLVEILTVIVLSSLLISFFLHADLAVNRSILRWIRRSSLEQASVRISRQFHRDVADADSITVRNEGTIEMFHRNTHVADYRFIDSGIERNGISLLPDLVQLSAFSCSPLNSEPGLQPTNKNFQSNQPLRLTLSLKRDDLITQTMIFPIRPYNSRHIK